MPSTGEKNRRSDLELWVIEHFRGCDAKEAISRYAAKLVESTGIRTPPVCMVKLAKMVGIDPWPVYELGTEGALKIVNGKLRIVLNRGRAILGARSSIGGRIRFTYAHEVAHALFYDLKSSPPVRLAPSGFDII